jgi:hypothetical protein
MASTTALSAADLYRTGQQSLGAPRFDARVREAAAVSTASAVKMFDILAQAAPEIIAAMPSLAACTVAGEPTRMFDDKGNCTTRGFACLAGVMPTASELELCSLTAQKASTPERGQAMAVAVVLAAAHLCE